MQKRISRPTALVAAVCIVLAHLAALSHETHVAHVRDELTGLVSHAHALAGAHHGATAASDIHGRDHDDATDLGDCAIIAGLEQVSIIPTQALAIIALAPLSQIPVARVATAPPVVAHLLLLAPKTSPPITLS